MIDKMENLPKVPPTDVVHVFGVVVYMRCAVTGTTACCSIAVYFFRITNNVKSLCVASASSGSSTWKIKCIFHLKNVDCCTLQKTTNLWKVLRAYKIT